MDSKKTRKLSKPNSKAKAGWSKGDWQLAAWEDDGPKVAKMLGKGANSDVEHVDGQDVWPLVISEGSVNIMGELIRAGWDVNLRMSRGATPLIHATSRGSEESVECMRLLIEGGCDVDAQGDSGWSALHVAAQCGYWKRAALLLGARCEIDARDVLGKSPALLAAEYGNSACLGLLLRVGADPLAMDRAGRSLWDVASEAGIDSGILALLRSEIDRRELSTSVPVGANGGRAIRI